MFTLETLYVPLRSAPSHKSEMLSQLLFGERFTIKARSCNWMKVLTEYDNYEGWVDGDQLTPTELKNPGKGSVLTRNLLCYKPDGTKMVLEPGCEVYQPDFTNKSFNVGENRYKTQTEFSESFLRFSGSMPDTAVRFLNSPYIWGGRIPSGIDCSGLTQLVFKMHGRKLSRDSWRQAEEGSTINFIDEAIPGDLVFFDNEAGRVTHVGMIYSRGLVIHASGRVRIDPVDQTGIFKREINNYSHKLRTIKRHE